jgi:hypothetical protein
MSGEMDRAKGKMRGIRRALSVDSGLRYIVEGEEGRIEMNE